MRFVGSVQILKNDIKHLHWRILLVKRDITKIVVPFVAATCIDGFMYETGGL